MPKAKPKLKGRAGSLDRIVGLRLVAKWRREAEDWRKELGAAIDAGSRGEIAQAVRTLRRCSGELDRKLALANDRTEPQAKL